MTATALTFTFRDPQPSSFDWLFNGVVRLIQVERLFGNHVQIHESDPDLQWIELKASRQRYDEYVRELKHMNYEFSISIDECFAQVRAEAFRQGCIFATRLGSWFIVRDASCMSLLLMQPAYCLESYLEDLIAVKEINRSEYTQDPTQMEIVRKQIVLTIYEYRCAMHPAAVDYLADLWLTVFGFRGRNELKQYVVGLASGPLTEALGDQWMMRWFNLHTDVILKTFREEDLRQTDISILDIVFDAFEEEFELHLLSPWN